MDLSRDMGRDVGMDVGMDMGRQVGSHAETLAGDKGRLSNPRHLP